MGISKGHAPKEETVLKKYNYLLDFFPDLFGGLFRVTAFAKAAGVTGAAKCAVSGMPTARLTAGWRRTVGTNSKLLIHLMTLGIYKIRDVVQRQKRAFLQPLS